MSAKRVHRQRRMLRRIVQVQFGLWYNSEPPIWKIFKWLHWKKQYAILW